MYKRQLSLFVKPIEISAVATRARVNHPVLRHARVLVLAILLLAVTPDTISGHDLHDQIGRAVQSFSTQTVSYTHLEMAVWPGDPGFELQRTGKIADGSAVNVSALNMGAHTGTHVDAPYHFEDDALTLDKVDLSVYWGPAQVVTVTKKSGPLTPEDFSGYDLGRAPRLLIHSPNSEADPNVFPQGFVHPSPELADHLGRHGVILYGACLLYTSRCV